MGDFAARDSPRLIEGAGPFGEPVDVNPLPAVGSDYQATLASSSLIPRFGTNLSPVGTNFADDVAWVVAGCYHSARDGREPQIVSYNKGGDRAREIDYGDRAATKRRYCQ